MNICSAMTAMLACSVIISSSVLMYLTSHLALLYGNISYLSLNSLSSPKLTYIVSVLKTHSDPCDPIEDRIISDWINNCFMVFDYVHDLVRIYDLNHTQAIILYRNQTEFPNPELMGCSLFQMSLREYSPSGFSPGTESLVMIPNSISETSIVVGANNFKYLFTTWEFNCNRLLYASLMNYTSFGYFSMKKLQNVSPYFIKTIAARQALRHSSYTMVLDFDSFFTRQAFVKKTQILQTYFPPESLGNYNLVLGSWKGSWFSSGLLIFRRSRWSFDFLCDWVSGPRQHYMLNDQISLFDVLLTRFTSAVTRGDFSPLNKSAALYFKDITTIGRDYRACKTVLQRYLKNYFGFEFHPYKENVAIPGGEFPDGVWLHNAYNTSTDPFTGRVLNETFLILHCAACRHFYYDQAYIIHTGHRSFNEFMSRFPKIVVTPQATITSLLSET